MLLKQQLRACFLVCLFLWGCLPTSRQPMLQELSIFRGDVEQVSYQVEVASDTASRRKGLMFRETLPANRGMLLDYKGSAKMAIWMKNTHIPLDIIFIDADGVIVKIHEGAVPYSTERIESETKVRAVLEVNAGQVRDMGIKTGDRVRHVSFKSR